MTPRGTLAYLAGVLALIGGLVLSELVLLVAFVLPGRPQREGAYLLLISGLVVFGAAHLLAAGLYRMLVHLYHTISRTDPAGDHRLRGRTLYVLGQLACAMTVPMAVLFTTLAVSEQAANDRALGMVLLGVLPSGVLLMLSLGAFFTGLGIMVRDTFLRNRDIVERREAERRRRLEASEEPQTEVIPVERPPADELREHVKEDR